MVFLSFSMLSTALAGLGLLGAALGAAGFTLLAKVVSLDIPFPALSFFLLRERLKLPNPSSDAELKHWRMLQTGKGKSGLCDRP